MTGGDGRDGCPEAIQHGPADGTGRCPWCGRKYTDARERFVARAAMTDAVQAYRRFYDPDWGTDIRDTDT